MRITIACLLCVVSVEAYSQNLSASYLYNTPSLFNPAFTGIENYLDIKIGGQRLDVGIQNPPGTAYFLMNGSLQGKTKSRGPKKVRYKSPYDIERLANEIPTPNNGLRISSVELYRKSIQDSIKRTVRQLDRKQKEELRKKLQKQSFEAAFKHGIGGQVYSQQSGPFKNTLMSTNYSIHLPLNKQWMASFGAAILYSNSTLDLTSLQFTDNTDPVLEKYSGGRANHNALSLSNGIVLYTRNFSIGYGIQNSLKLVNPEATAVIFESVTGLKHNFSIYGLVDLNVDWKWQNGLHISTDHTQQTRVQLLSRAIYKNRMGLGGAYDFESRYSFNSFLILSDFIKLNYIIDLPTSNASGNNVIVNEISINFMINRGGAPSPYFF